MPGRDSGDRRSGCGGGYHRPEGSELARLVDTYVRAVEASDLDKRLRAIEEKMAK